MTERPFTSALAERMTRFVKLRRLSGTDYRTQRCILTLFDRFLAEHGFTAQYVTQEAYVAYVATLSHLHRRYRSNQCSVIRQLAIYVSQSEPRCYVPEPVPAGSSHDDWRPHIFSRDQIRDLLSAASCLEHGWIRPHVFRVLFGLLYTTGMRIGETLALNIGDFYPEQLRLYVRRGKFGKARWVPVSRSTGHVLEEYLPLRAQAVTKEAGPPPLFISTLGKRLARCTAEIVFPKLVRQCGIRGANRRAPRIHDLRHTFAVHRLLEWYRDGRDVNARLPWLATYMGHAHISSTQIYIQATPELHQCANERFLNFVRSHGITGGNVR